MPILFSDKSNKFTNSGTIRGDVYMQAGNDLYDGSNGLLYGGVYGDSGKDRLIGGVRGEVLDGGTGSDRLDGGGGKDTLRGGLGNDILNGGVGHDALNGGAGKDTLIGGEGRDTFVFGADGALSTADIIKDFASADDTIRINNTFFDAVGPNGALKAAALRFGTKAKDSSDRIIYDKDTGRLSYDADGAGGDAQITIAVLANKAALKLADFFVI
jgi:serralysin